jgi:hypothetical protein
MHTKSQEVVRDGRTRARAHARTHAQQGDRKLVFIFSKQGKHAKHEICAKETSRELFQWLPYIMKGLRLEVNTFALCCV